MSEPQRTGCRLRASNDAGKVQEVPRGFVRVRSACSRSTSLLAHDHRSVSRNPSAAEATASAKRFWAPPEFEGAPAPALEDRLKFLGQMFLNASAAPDVPECGA